MSLQELSNRLLKKLIQTYYSGKPLEEPQYLPKREVAIYSMEDKVYIRHLYFPSMKNLYDYILRKKTPLHLYYSSAYYEDPSAGDMESKGWLGSDLIFDIDVDHFPGCDNVISFCPVENRVYNGKIKSCSDSSKPIMYPMISFECILKGWREAQRLIEILQDDLGFKTIKTSYSGNRGFHIRVLDGEVRKLTGEHRRQIVEYLTLKNIDLNRILPSTRRGYVYFSENEYGWRKRIVEYLRSTGLVEEEGRTLQVKLEAVEDALRDLAVNIDPVVTMDVSRLSRFEYSIHGKSGLTVYPLDPAERLEERKYMSFSPFTGEIKVEPLVSITGLPVLDSKVDLNRGVRLKLPSYQAIYLALKGLALITDISGVEARNVRRIH